VDITRVGASQGTSSGGVTSRALTRTPTTVSNLLIAAFLVADATAVPTISDTAGNTWNVCNPLNQDATNSGASLSWWAVANGTGSTTVTVQSNAPSQFCSMFLEEFTGNHPSAPLNAQVVSPDGASGTPISPTIAPTVDNCLIWAACWDNITAVGNIGGSAATKGGDDASADWTEFRVLVGGGGVGITAAFTGSGAYNLMAAAFKPLATTAALTGTVTASITEADIVAGGKTIITTLTADTWTPSD
jgi:hypothetical protein